MTNAITKRGEAEAVITRAQDRICAALPALIDKQRFMEIAVGLVRSNPDIQACHPNSIAMAIYGVARLGLMPDPALGHVYVVPYKNRATVMPGYRGLIELARRSGAVTSVHTNIVHENDEFDLWVDEDGPHLKHRPYHVMGQSQPGKPTHVYCVAAMNNGNRQVEVMQWADIQKIKNSAQTGMVWNKHESEMARKTVVRRASKYWPLSPELGRAVQFDEEAERGALQSISVQLDDEAHPPAGDAGADTLLDEVSDAASEFDELTQELNDDQGNEDNSGPEDGEGFQF
jgi:recombination protein RecT